VFDAPGAGTNPGEGTSGAGINPAGTVTGNYIDVNNVYHGFARALSGGFVTFDAPGAGTGAGQGTQPCPDGASGCINPAGLVTGSMYDANNVIHGFIYTP
jgi:hypothetical protein